jgi:hypothetical protein
MLFSMRLRMRYKSYIRFAQCYRSWMFIPNPGSNNSNKKGKVDLLSYLIL